MARNVLSVWNGRPKCMGRAARAHVANRYSWERTFQRLFCEVYPAALRRAEERVKRRRSNPGIGGAVEQTV